MDSSSTADVGLNNRDLRRVYLITCSQADVSKFPTRVSFAEAVIAAFSKVNNTILQWCCSQEHHNITGGIHYRMCVKIKNCQRWLPVKKFLSDSYGISVHFSSLHANYYTAWRYVTKEDQSTEESEGHPDLKNSNGPKTMNAHIATKALRSKRGLLRDCDGDDEDCCVSEGEMPATTDLRSEGKPTKAKRRKRLSAYEFSQIIVEKGLKNRTDVLAFAHMQKNEGKTDVAEFIVNRGAKVVNDAIQTAWEMEGAKAAQERMAKSRMEILHEARQETCKCEPISQWHNFALELLENNGIPRESFGNAVEELLRKGRGKYRNLMLTGPANCGKTFLLNPLNSIYKTFTNPACTSFAWVGAEQAEVLFLNDFRWSPQIIAWHDFLLMLEGQLVHLPAPKSHFAKDNIFERDTPIFATSKHQLVYVRNGVIDERETEMMSVRWQVFNFNRQVPQSKQKDIVPCPTCFARLVCESFD